jgi:hypothetical protein
MLKSLAISVSPRSMGRATLEIRSAFQLATQTTSASQRHDMTHQDEKQDLTA